MSRMPARVLLMGLTRVLLMGLIGLWLGGVVGSVGSVAAGDGEPEWIGVEREHQRERSIGRSTGRSSGRVSFLRTTFPCDERPTRALLRVAGDFCETQWYLNGEPVWHAAPFAVARQLDVTGRLRVGENTLAVCCRAVDGPTAVFARLELQLASGERQTIVSDSRWQAALRPDESQSQVQIQNLQWREPESSAWRPAKSFGPVTDPAWTLTPEDIAIRPLDDYTQWTRAQGDDADPATFQLREGFEIERVHSAREDEGSWVCLEFDPEGRLIIAREKQGLLRLTLPEQRGEPPRVEVVEDTLHECRGLAFHDGDLYAMANNDRALFRLRDDDGDGRFDEPKKLAEFPGDLGHGRNQIAFGPDGRLYCIFGDSVFEPTDAQKLPPTLSHPTDVEKSRSGFVARRSADGQWEVLVRGLRNPFGLAFNADGELFTYDADAEYDMGAPWYRPTRVNHLLPGGDYGWRQVTKQWPPYDPDRPDMPQPMLAIGKGSPTAVAFATGSHFPPPYRDALFVLDWAYGRILAVHMTPRGAGYAAGAETFLRGRPLNVTDLAFGPDGAMYFVTGGRGTQSALYRVRHVGPAVPSPAATAQQRAGREHAESARKLRRRLEALHGQQDSRALEVAWPHLASADPWIRHAARAAVEWQPVARWRQRALTEDDPRAALAALLALSRVGSPEDGPRILARLNELPWEALDPTEKQAALFLYDRCLAETGSASDSASESQRQAARRLDPLYPDPSPAVNRRLSLILSGPQHSTLNPQREDFIARTLELLRRAETQEDRLHYLFVLRDVADGWTDAARKSYFEELRRMDEFLGGEGMPTFRRLIAEAALKSLEALPPDQRGEYEELLQTDATARWQAEVPDEPRPVVRQWTLDDLADALPQVAADGARDFEQGRRAFAAARCILCHRVGDRGGVVGPDLSQVAGRFRPADVLTAVLDPSKVVPENYRSHAFQLRDGRVVVGRVAPGGDYRSPELRVITDPLAPDKPAVFAKADVEQQRPSTVSPMPEGLLNTLTREEILDLLAYLESGGNPRHPAFRR